MGKEGQLLDDSALITAFDQAISNYKNMHGKGYNGNSSNDVSGDVINNSTDAPLDNFSNPETAGDGNANGSHVLLEVEVEVEEAGNLATVPKNEVTESPSSKEHALESNSLAPQDQSQYYVSSINSEEYNVLYKQYYEIEEQRQKILQQMQHFSNEYYPYSGEASTSGVQWGTNCATQEYQVTSQMPCQCPVASCSSLTCPNVGTHGDAPSTTNGLEIKSTVDNVDFVAEALGAAERALSTLKNKTFDSEKGNKVYNVVDQNTNSETDLSTVLNAWYSAGFYTGKYLSEKSLAKKRND